jgi:hypothetical protein
MPNHLEFVVRPSQAPQIRPGVPTQIFATPKIVVNDPIVWGSSGDSVFSSNASSQVELPQPKWEESRTYDVVRVFNPDDHSQFVDTEQMTEYQARNKIGKDRITLRFATNTNTDDTEVISTGNIRKSNVPSP